MLSEVRQLVDFVPSHTASAEFSGGESGPLVFTAVPTVAISAVVAPFFKGDPGVAGPRGQPGPPGNGPNLRVPFAFGDASPRLVLTDASQLLIFSVRVHVSVPFDGVGSALSVGTQSDTDAFVPGTQVDLGVSSEFEFSPNVILGANEGLLFTLVSGAGATRGSGWIVIEKIPVT